MVRTVVEGYLDVNNVVSCQNTGLHGTLDTCINRRDVFLRNYAADDVVDEFVSFAGLVGLNADFNVTVLTAATGLAGIFVVDISRFADGFLIGNLGSANVCFNLEFAKQAVNDNFQVQLTHTGDNGLAGFLISVGPEGRVFFSKL